jgi:hypothetical protein
MDKILIDKNGFIEYLRKEWREECKWAKQRKNKYLNKSTEDNVLYIIRKSLLDEGNKSILTSSALSVRTNEIGKCVEVINIKEWWIAKIKLTYIEGNEDKIGIKSKMQWRLTRTTEEGEIFYHEDDENYYVIWFFAEAENYWYWAVSFPKQYFEFKRLSEYEDEIDKVLEGLL